MTDVKSGATALGTEPIGKLLMQYAVPAIIAMTASSLYNMVDSIFIGQGVGPLAISGLAIAFPLMNLSAAFGTLVGLGCATLVSVRLGQKDYATAERVLGNCVTMNVVLGLLLTVVALTYLDPILVFFGSSEATIGYARGYMEIIILGNVITHLYMGLNAMLRSSGHPKQAMCATIATVVLNTILDPIFIYGFDMGIRGAAVATVLAQIVSLVWELWLFSRKGELLQFKRGIFRPNRRIINDSFSIGMAPFLMNLAACLVVLLINHGLVRYSGDLAVGAFGIVNRLVFVVVMICVGFNQAMRPICGYNYGGTVSNCYNTGAVTGKSIAGGVCGNNYALSATATIKNCYYNSDKYTGKAVNNTNGTVTDVEGKTTEQLKSGEVCYLLNGKNSENTSGNPLIWYQNIGSESSDISPVLDNSHRTV